MFDSIFVTAEVRNAPSTDAANFCICISRNNDMFSVLKKANAFAFAVWALVRSAQNM
jgi:hypothetical protein